MIGTLLKDTYQIEAELGKGGMGDVYIARHKTLPRRFAVKFLRLPDEAPAGLLERFEREAMIASGLGHPNIVEVIDFDRQPDGSPFIVMELLEGETLAARLKKGLLSRATVAAIVRQTADEPGPDVHGRRPEPLQYGPSIGNRQASDPVEQRIAVDDGHGLPVLVQFVANHLADLDPSKVHWISDVQRAEACSPQ